MNPEKYFKSMRLGNCIIAVIGVLVGFFVSAKELVLAPGIGFAIMAAFLITAGGNAINNFFDAEIDNRLQKNNEGWKSTGLFYFSMALLLTGIFLAGLVNIHAIVIAGMTAIMLFAYSAIMQKYKFVGNIVVALGTALTIVFGASITQNYLPVLPIAFAAFFANIGREITKDAEDMKGDVGFKRTLPMITGFENIKKIVLAVYILAIASALTATALGFLKGAIFTVLIMVSSLVFFFSYKELSQKNYSESQKLSKLAMLIALAAFVGGTL